MREAFDEVNRRASAIGCSNFDCTYEQALAKYYHADVHGLEFPEGFKKDYANKLKPADRKTYIASRFLDYRVSVDLQILYEEKNKYLGLI